MLATSLSISARKPSRLPSGSASPRGVASISRVCWSSVRPPGATAFHEALDKRDGVEALGDAVSRLANTQLDHATA